VSELWVFLGKAILISLSGVMAPGALTAATIATGATKRHAGALVAFGHGIVELPLVVLIVLGIADLLKIDEVKIGVGLAGGAFMLVMAIGLFQTARRGNTGPAGKSMKSPLVTGIVLSASNPYFLLWWATVGLALATEAVSLGIFAFAIFAAVHWLLDFIWLELLSLTAFHGTRLMSGRVQGVILAICALALVYFGGSFLVDAFSALIDKAAPAW